MGQARESKALVPLMDLAPTLMDLAGASYDPNDLDAKSFLSTLEGAEQSPHEVQQSELMNTIMLFDGRSSGSAPSTTAASCMICRRIPMSCATASWNIRRSSSAFKNIHSAHRNGGSI